MSIEVIDDNHDSILGEDNDYTSVDNIDTENNRKYNTKSSSTKS